MIQCCFLRIATACASVGLLPDEGAAGILVRIMPSTYCTRSAGHSCLRVRGCRQQIFRGLLLQALSVTLRKQTLDGAMRNVGKLKAAVDKCKETDATRLTNEYKRLVGGLQVIPCKLCGVPSRAAEASPTVLAEVSHCRLWQLSLCCTFFPRIFLY